MLSALPCLRRKIGAGTSAIRLAVSIAGPGTGAALTHALATTTPWHGNWFHRHSARIVHRCRVGHRQTHARNPCQNPLLVIKSATPRRGRRGRTRSSRRGTHGVSAGAAPARASATRRCCAPWTRCRASISSSGRVRRKRLCRPRAADRVRADHQPALRRRLHDRAASRCEPQHRVLEVGTGSGYQAAILSRLAREVVSVERYRTLAETARAAPADARL